MHFHIKYFIVAEICISVFENTQLHDMGVPGGTIKFRIYFDMWEKTPLVYFDVYYNIRVSRQIINLIANNIINYRAPSSPQNWIPAGKMFENSSPRSVPASLSRKFSFSYFVDT